MTRSMDLKLFAFSGLKHNDLLDPAHISLSFILHLSLCPSSPVELDCHLLAQLSMCAASSCTHLVLAAAGPGCCQDPSPLLCSRACYCCSLLVLPGKDNVQSDVPVIFNKNESQHHRCSSGRPLLARGYAAFCLVIFSSIMYN